MKTFQALILATLIIATIGVLSLEKQQENE
jgi:hypothetical protein